MEHNEFQQINERKNAISVEKQSNNLTSKE